jgi:hypothetical protein
MGGVRRAVVAALGVTVAAAGAAAAGTSDGQGAQKSGLSPTAGSMSSQCNAGSGANANGFGILNAPGKVGAVQKVNGEVSLKRGTPDTTYVVNLAQGGNCMPVAMLTTNGNGNGNAHINVSPGMAGTYYVVLQLMGQEVYATAPVAVK